MLKKHFNELQAAGFTMIEEQPIILEFLGKGCKYFARPVRGPDEKNWNVTKIL